MGRIEVICGSMFSGKTEELIRRINKVEKTNLQLMKLNFFQMILLAFVMN